MISNQSERLIPAIATTVPKIGESDFRRIGHSDSPRIGECDFRRFLNIG